jgi:NADH-quinone oxidoreductase subunit A
LFDVELVFLFPWAIVFGREDLIKGTNGLWGWFSLVEMFVFVGILSLGLAYAWVKGHLNWVKPNPEISTFKSPVPSELYERINQKY